MGLLLVMNAGPSRAQLKSNASPPLPASKPASNTAGANSAKHIAAVKKVPDGPALSILIRRTLLTLNDANLSGNYTVLRDLAAPGFQSANDAAKLATIFAKLRETKIDMAPIVYFDPKLVRKPEIAENGMLRLTGFMSTQPQQINFDMLFQNVSSRWLLFGIAVNTTLAKAASATPAAKSKGTAGMKNKKK